LNIYSVLLLMLQCVCHACSNTFVPVAQLRYQHHVNVANAE
jgi:hypothetical protein